MLCLFNYECATDTTNFHTTKSSMTCAVQREILNRQTEFYTELLKKRVRLLVSYKHR